MTKNKSLEGIIDNLLSTIGKAWEVREGGEDIDDLNKYEEDYDEARRKAIADLKKKYKVVASGELDENDGTLYMIDEDDCHINLSYEIDKRYNGEKIEISIREL